MSLFSRRSLLASALVVGLAPSTALFAQDKPKEIRIDWATYNPVSMVLKEQGLLEKEFAKDGISVRWVQTLGSNKALEFLNAGSIDFGSSAGAAALVSKINGNPIKSIYVYSQPEWTALVARKDTSINKIADLKGKRVAVTRGTDPHIFLVRALQSVKLTERDITPVLLQHPDGKTALIRGDVDAWAGLDPMMAQAEVEDGARLFYRNKDANTWGILNVREQFLKDHPDLVRRVLAVSFGLSAALGALAGILVAPISFTSWDVGVMLGLKGFAAAILGGLGSGPGAIAGGLALGLLEALGAGYLSSAYKDVFAFVLLLAALVLLPNGLAGRRAAERV